MTPSKPNPALVTHEAARRLPRLALLLFCAAYVLPGLFGRDPWRGADLVAFGQMLSIAEGRAPWLAPALGGVPTDAALLPHWIGAAAIVAGRGWLDPALAARLPFAALLVLTLVAVWHATYHLARSDAAQPLPLAFGGEASRVDYARALADGALLVLIATLGLLEMGHQTTPELAQLAAVAGLQWSLAAAPQGRRRWPARAGVLVSLPLLSACGAPVVALAWGLGGLLLALRRPGSGLDGLVPWLLVAMAGAALLAWPAGSWAWRLGQPVQPWALGKLLLWFLWPAWALALWTVWRWRGQLGQRHLALPLLGLGVSLATCVAMGGSDKALMLGLPGVAVLSAFALPTLQRSSSAAIDWLSVFFFSGCAVFVWVYYVAMQTGWPPKAQAAVARLAPGYPSPLVWQELLLGLAATAAWLWLVRWRTARHQVVIWKSVVLPAGGVALCWLLLMTLWLPVLDYGRSNRPLAERLVRHVPEGRCIAAPGASPSLVAALEHHGRRRVDARPQASALCPVQMLELAVRGPQAAAHAALLQSRLAEGWQERARERRPTDRQTVVVVLQR